MAEKLKKHTNIKQGNHQLITVYPSLSSLESQSFFEQKAARAKETLKKVGLPVELLQTKKSNS